MNSAKSVSFLSSITTKITVALAVTFTIIIALVFYVVDKEGYEQIKGETDKLIIEKGEHIVDIISFDIASVMRSATQLKDTSEVLPINNDDFQKGLNTVFHDNNHTLLGSGGIWPDAYKFDANIEALPLTRVRETNGYSQLATAAQGGSYLSQPWFKAVQQLNPQSCLWNHATLSQAGQNLAISCGLSIDRDNEFWGAATVNFSLESIQKNIETLSEQMGDGYVILVDNSNQVIASSIPSRMTEKAIGALANADTSSTSTTTDIASTGIASTDSASDSHAKPLLRLQDLVAVNPALQTVADTVNRQRQTIIAQATSTLPPELVTKFNQLDKALGVASGSSLINYTAHLQDINPNTPSVSTAFLESYTLQGDKVFRADSQAYVFAVPETLWKMVFVKPTREVNAIADHLSKNLIKYLMFALIGAAAIIFFLIDALALRPLEATTNRILKAEKLIDDNKYNELSQIRFRQTGRDEIGIVNTSLMALLQRIESNEGKLADVNQQLEVKVEERTAELKDTLKELKSSQVQLIRSEKMATLGQMVAGVAHEVNTPLSYVQNNLEIIGQLTEMYEALIEQVEGLKSAMVDPENKDADIAALVENILETADEIAEDDLTAELRELIKDSLFGVEQITDMVLNLRNFARLDESKVKTIAIEECIESSLKISRNSIKHLDVVTEYKPTPEVKCSPSQINQILVNLVNNAAQAVGDKPDGKIVIQTDSDADNVYIDIIDNGSGMSAEVQEKIFEPFFTTKAAGEGTGLGMAICQQIIEQHEGKIELNSQEGVGTTFHITLPISGVAEHAAKVA